MTSPGRAADRPRRPRIAYASGIAFVVTAVVAFFLAGGPDVGATNDEVVAYFRDNENAYRWQAFLFGLAAAFFVWFFGALAARIRSVEVDPPSGVSPIVVLSSATTAALYVVGVAAWTGLATTAQEDGATRALFDFGEQAFALSNFTAAALVLAVAIAVMRTGFVADSPGWTGVILATFLVINGAVQMFNDGDWANVMGYIAFLGFVAWTLLVSLLLTFERERPALPAATA